MPNLETTVVETTNTGSVKADWAQLAAELGGTKVETIVEQPKVEPEVKPEEIAIEPKVEPTPEPVIEPKVEPTAEEKLKLETETLVTEAKELGLPETATRAEVDAEKAKNKPLEITLEDIVNVPPVYKEGTFQALAKDVFNVDLATESQEEFQKAFVPRSELEKLQNVTLDTVLSGLKPEVATAIKLMQMGLTEDQVLQPTRDIDSYLALGDAELVRANLSATEGWTEELIDNKIEALTAENKLALDAAEIRIGLNHNKKKIIENRTQTLQKYEADKQSALQHQKQLEQTQIINELNNVSTYMGVSIGKDAVKAIITKYNNGLYDKELNSPAAKRDFILYKELGEKLAKHIQNKASEKAMVDQKKALLNVPPVIAGAGQKVNPEQKQPANQWELLTNDLKATKK